MYKRIKCKLNTNQGMTMAELLAVVAIVMILAGVAFIGVMQYQRSMTQLERDNIAKEIFVAAQNHLTAAKGQNYLGQANGDKLGNSDGRTGVYYIEVKNGQVQGEDVAMYDVMLPFGSIDDTVRKGGSYVLIYSPSTSRVLDVFYWEESPEKYKYVFEAENYSTLKGLRGKEKKSLRRSYGDDNSVIGWWGDTEVLEVLPTTLQPPKIKIINKDTLSVDVWDDETNPAPGSGDGVVLRVMITGKQSGARTYRDLPGANQYRNGAITSTAPLNLVLDDITGITGGMNAGSTHFDKEFNSGTNMEDDDIKFIPGEDLEIKVIQFSKLKLSNIGESASKEVNSLFESISDEKGKAKDGSTTQYTLDSSGNMLRITSQGDGVPDTAYVKYIRHLENLDKAVSNLDANDESDKLNISQASQTADMKWSTFKSYTKMSNGRSVYYSGTRPADDSVYDPTSCGGDSYKPVRLNDGFVYDGMNHSIQGIQVNASESTHKIPGNAGLFSELKGNTKVKNLALIDFNVVSAQGVKEVQNPNEFTYNAGGLAGLVDSSSIENVIVRRTMKSDEGATATATTPVTVTVSGNNSAGGLVGRMSGGSIRYSAAAADVEGQIAGGLVGSIASNGTILGSYAGGKTDHGEYFEHDGDKRKQSDNKDIPIYSVTGTTHAGGLVGTINAGSISNCYATASAKATDGVAGGLAGSSTGTISNSYCTGLVKGKTEHAFVGTGNTGDSGTGNRYYSIVNEKDRAKDSDPLEYLEPASKDNTAGISAFDESTKAFKEFNNGICDAEPYDEQLGKFYSDKYVLKPISKLDEAFGNTTNAKKYEKYFVHKHYGDWAAPEIFVVND